MSLKQRGPRVRDGQGRRPRRDLRILTPEDLKPSQDRGLLARDEVRSRFDSELRAYVVGNRKEAKERASAYLSREVNKRKELGRFTRFHMGDIQVSQLEAGSSRGARLANSNHRNQVDFRAIRSLLSEYSRGRGREDSESSTKRAARRERRQIIAKFGKNPLDTGSTAVQIALKTARIEALKSHFATAKKDKHSKRGFIQLIQSRKALLRYLKDRRPEEYKRVITELNLRK